MARRRASKALGYQVLFWVAPAFSLVLAPLFLHAAADGTLHASTDEHLLAAAALLLSTLSLSVLGCVLHEPCACPRGFPLVVLATQATLLVGAFVLRFSLYPGPGALPRMPQLAHFRPRASLATGAASGPQAAAPPARPAAAATGAEQPAVEVRPVAAVEVAPAELVDAGHAPDPKAAEVAARPAAAAEVAAQDLKAPHGWRVAGEGYCEDGETHDEFNSLHAVGVTFQACVEAGNADPKSVALDFSPADGGCDVRYPSGALPEGRPGFEWWGWGAGTGHAAGSGKQKHDAATRCFAKVLAATAAPAAASWAHRTELHPAYGTLIREYPFQPVRNERQKLVNIILVRAPFRSPRQEKLYERYKDEILFLGISSFEDYPLSPPNPFSAPFPKDKYVGLFPGFLHMFRDTKVFPSHVKLLLMSQSDFCLPPPAEPVPKKYDFTFSGSDQDVYNDCVGWANYAKNWSFVKQSLEVMCGELKMTGVLVATVDKENRKSCTIPASCKGLITQTQYIPQDQFFDYVKQSRFLFVPQVHDASPRVASQGLALDVPLLMNRNIMGGWKYVNEKTGEFFNDISDFRASVQTILRKAKAGGIYEPRKWVDANAGDAVSGARLRDFVMEHFQDRVTLPHGTQLLFPSGA